MFVKKKLSNINIGIFLLAALLALIRPVAAQQVKTDDIPEGWELVPRVSIALEYGGFAFQHFDYVSMLKRYLEVDILQYQRNILYMKFDENTFFGVPGNKWEFNLMKFVLVIGGYRYDFGNFYLGLFFHHQCNNIFLTREYQDKTYRERANIYDVGFEFLTKNLRVGMEDRNINFDSSDNFEFLHRFAAGFWASRALTADRIYLKWMVKTTLRYDILRYKRLIPYLQATCETLLGSDNKVVPTAEAGCRYHLGPRMDIIPFVQWSQGQLALLTSNRPEQTPYFGYNYLYGGVRLETLLDKQYPGSLAFDDFKLLPAIHGHAGYSFFMNNPDFNGHGNIRLYLYALQMKSWVFFVDTDMLLNTRKEDFKPDKVAYSVQYGLTHYWEKYFLEGFVNNQVRLDSNIYRGTSEQSNLAGIRAGSKGMKPGFYDFGIVFDKTKNFQWLNNWQGQASAGRYFSNHDWQYLWDLALQLRWNLCRLKFIVPYIQGDLNWRAGLHSTKDSLEYAVEPGLRFHGTLDLALYYRFQHVKNNLLFPGPYQDQNLFGIKVLF